MKKKPRAVKIIEVLPKNSVTLTLADGIGVTLSSNTEKTSYLIREAERMISNITRNNSYNSGDVA